MRLEVIAHSDFASQRTLRVGGYDLVSHFGKAKPSGKKWYNTHKDADRWRA